MTIQLSNRTVFHCRCQKCEHEWDALVKPARCAKCKSRTWNGEDRRLPDPFLETAPNSRIENYKKPPQLRYRHLYTTLGNAGKIICDLIDDNPCNHAKNQCVCKEKEVLADIERQIEAIGLLAGRRKEVVNGNGNGKAE